MNENETQRFDALTMRLGEHFKDYLVIVRPQRGEVMWRASDPNWAESCAREYTRMFNFGCDLRQAYDFNTRRNNG